MPIPSIIRNPHAVVEEVVKKQARRQLYPTEDLSVEDDIGESNPTVHRQYRRSVQQNKQELENKLKSLPDNATRATVLCAGMVLALVLQSSGVYRPSMRSLYKTLLNKYAFSIFSNLRSVRTQVTKEIRVLLRKGPSRYYNDALAELASLKRQN